MASAFWNARGIIFMDYLQKGTTITKKRQHLPRKKLLFHQDHAPVHTMVIAVAKINELTIDLFP